MGENYTNLFFYTRPQEEIYDPRKYQQLVEGLVALDFYVALPGEETDQKTLTAPGISSIVQQSVQDALGTTQYPWVLQVYSHDPSEPSGGFAFRMDNDSMEETEDEAYGALALDYLYRIFDESTNSLAMYEHFLQAVRLIYEIYHPVYGYQFDPRDGRAVTAQQEALAFQIHTLYDINLFGPELVGKLGRERLESAPAERVIPLDDGGIMLLPYVPFSNSYSYNLKEVGEHLGLAYPEI